jgi:Raf kinase inhibitor-like YbhB/YbcL family protein
MRKSISLVSLLVCVGSATAFADSDPDPSTAQSNAPKKLMVTSSDFKNGEAIPSENTCEGANKAPQLSWSNVPPETKSIAILVDDPGAGKTAYTHMLVTGIPPTEKSISGGAALPTGAEAAKNDKGTTGYTGPCPTNAAMHHYYFRVYALDTMIQNPTSGASFLREIKGHVVAQGALVGTFQKSHAGMNAKGAEKEKGMGAGSAAPGEMGSGPSSTDKMGSGSAEPSH